MHSCTREMAGFRCDMKEADFPCMASAVDKAYSGAMTLYG